MTLFAIALTITGLAIIGPTPAHTQAAKERIDIRLHRNNVLGSPGDSVSWGVAGLRVAVNGQNIASPDSLAQILSEISALSLDRGPETLKAEIDPRAKTTVSDLVAILEIVRDASISLATLKGTELPLTLVRHESGAWQPLDLAETGSANDVTEQWPSGNGGVHVNLNESGDFVMKLQIIEDDDLARQLAIFARFGNRHPFLIRADKNALASRLAKATKLCEQQGFKEAWVAVKTRAGNDAAAVENPGSAKSIDLLSLLTLAGVPFAAFLAWLWSTQRKHKANRADAT